MRLIDADAFLERTRKDPLFPLVERYGLSGVIENEPTVEAIPVKWLTDRFCNHRTIHTEKSMMREVYLKEIIKMWRKENEVD